MYVVTEGVTATATGRSELLMSAAYFFGSAGCMFAINVYELQVEVALVLVSIIITVVPAAAFKLR
jgi:hypothetical protein